MCCEQGLRRPTIYFRRVASSSRTKTHPSDCLPTERSKSIRHCKSRRHLHSRITALAISATETVTVGDRVTRQQQHQQQQQLDSREIGISSPSRLVYETNRCYIDRPRFSNRFCAFCEAASSLHVRVVYINYVTQRSSDVSWCHRSANKPQVMRQRLFQHKIQQPSFVVAPTILLIIFNRGE